MEICKLDLHVLLFFHGPLKVMLPWLSSLSSKTMRYMLNPRSISPPAPIMK